MRTSVASAGKAGGSQNNLRAKPDTAQSSGSRDSRSTKAQNPFVLPNDEQIFLLREEEKRQKAEHREALKHMSVADKSTFSSRFGTVKPVEPRKPAAAAADGTVAVAGTDAVQSLGLAEAPRRHEREDIAEFIAKKREIFLVQMALDTKRTEIRKLEERALQREEDIKRSEEMLEADALRFDTFLKENDEKVQEALRRADAEARAKAEKVAEVKRLTAAIAAARAELNKYEEQLEDSRKYKEFLSALTPPEWFEEQRRLREEEAARAKEERRQARLADIQAEVDKRKEELLAQQPPLPKEQLEAQLEALVVQLPDNWDANAPPPPDDDEPMYFTNPKQLLDVFAALEEQNLFLIQSSQETEEQLEELLQTYRETKKRMDAETAGLHAQVAALEAAIAEAEAKASALREKVNVNNKVEQGGDGVSLEELTAKVSEVYVRCGFEADNSISTLQMLANIESKLEEYLAMVNALPPDFVEAMEKQKEKERRAKLREENLKLQKAEQERRQIRSLERFNAPVPKWTKKPEMKRSFLPDKKTVRARKDAAAAAKAKGEWGPATEEEELAEFMARGY